MKFYLNSLHYQALATSRRVGLASVASNIIEAGDVTVLCLTSDDFFSNVDYSKKLRDLLKLTRIKRLEIAGTGWSAWSKMQIRKDLSEFFQAPRREHAVRREGAPYNGVTLRPMALKRKRAQKKQTMRTVSSATYRYNLNPESLSKELAQRLAKPQCIHQGPINCCGVAAVTIQTAVSKPEIFAKMTMDLAKQGYCDHGDWHFEVQESRLRPKGATLSEIFMNALNNSSTYYSRVGIASQHVQALEQMIKQGFRSEDGSSNNPLEKMKMTLPMLLANLPRQVAKLLQGFGYKILKETAFFSPIEMIKKMLPKHASDRVHELTYSEYHQNASEIDFAQELMDIEFALAENKKVIVLFDLKYNLKMTQTDTDDEYSLPMVHYNYLNQFHVDTKQGVIDCELFTWGQAFKYHGSLVDLKEGYRGSIISEKLLNNSRKA